MEQKVTRKEFFREFMGLISRAASEITTAEQQNSSFLMPPGISSRTDFLNRCSRCYECISRCPHEALQVCRETHSELYGFPVIDPRRQPCLFCSDFPCISACDEQVLSLDCSDKPIGTAVIDRSRCLISQGSFCRACISRCPTHALCTDKEGFPKIKTERCNGCGECVQACPSEKPAVFIHSAH